MIRLIIVTKFQNSAGIKAKRGRKSLSFSKNERNLYVKTPNFPVSNNFNMREGYKLAEMERWLKAGKRIIFIYI